MKHANRAENTCCTDSHNLINCLPNGTKNTKTETHKEDTHTP